MDAAAEGDVIQVAAGTYTGVQERPVPSGILVKTAGVPWRGTAN